MNRRNFLKSAAAGSLLVDSSAQACLPPSRSRPVTAPESRLAGLTISELRRRCRDELFDLYLPFWDRHGIDHERGGFMAAMGHDGTLINGDKFHWFQGRGVWIYSYLYNHFGKDPTFLEIARKSKEFMLRHFPLEDGWWGELVTREGDIIRPFRGDVYGMLFGAEGLQEYSVAADDDEALEVALDLIRRCNAYIQRPEFRFMGHGPPGVRGQNLWMVLLQISTQILRRWDLDEIAEISDQCVDAIVRRHYNTDIGLNNEMLNLDFSRPEGEETRCQLGHSIENYWIVLDEALRRNDSELADLCIERIRRHFEVGWDGVYGGLALWINVGQGCYRWPPHRPIFTDLEFQYVGEYNYVKTLWAIDECLIALLKVYELTRATWAADYFSRCQNVVDEGFSVQRFGQPLWMYFTDRQFTYQPVLTRHENYHRPRQYIHNIQTLDRLMGKSTSTRRTEAAAGDSFPLRRGSFPEYSRSQI